MEKVNQARFKGKIGDNSVDQTWTLQKALVERISTKEVALYECFLYVNMKHNLESSFWWMSCREGFLFAVACFCCKCI